MIKVNFTNGTSKRYAIGCKDLLCGSWEGIDYQWAFEPIAKIVGVNVNKIESWQVK